MEFVLGFVLGYGVWLAGVRLCSLLMGLSAGVAAASGSVCIRSAVARCVATACCACTAMWRVEDLQRLGQPHRHACFRYVWSCGPKLFLSFVTSAQAAFQCQYL